MEREFIQSFSKLTESFMKIAELLNSKELKESLIKEVKFRMEYIELLTNEQCKRLYGHPKKELIKACEKIINLMSKN